MGFKNPSVFPVPGTSVSVNAEHGPSVNYLSGFSLLMDVVEDVGQLRSVVVYLRRC